MSCWGVGRGVSDGGGVVGLGSSAAGWWSKSGLIMLFCCLLR